MNNHTSKLAHAATSLTMIMLLSGCSTTPTDEAPQPTAATVSAGSDTSLMTAGASTPSTSSAPTSTSTVNLASDNLKCERIQVTGSHMYRKVCTTKAQREYLRQQTEEFARIFGRMRATAQ